MSYVVLDDFLLRRLLVGSLPPAVRQAIRRRTPATTNMYLFRLARSAVAARGGSLTGSLSADGRAALARRLVALPEEIEILPMRSLAYRMATISAAHRISTLGAEALAAAEALDAPLMVWERDDGPQIRVAADAIGVPYQTVATT